MFRVPGSRFLFKVLGFLLLFLVLVLVPVPGTARAQDLAKDPDRLYADREHLQSAIDAAAIWDARVAKDPKDFESMWKLARSCYWLGGHVAADDRRKQYERGIDVAKKAVALR